jgi:hypothetical protein
MELERFTKLTPDWTGQELRVQIVVKGPVGAVEFAIWTRWPTIPSYFAGYNSMFAFDYNLQVNRPIPVGRESHWDVPCVDEEKGWHECSLTNSGFCYHDGSSLAGDNLWNILMKKGTDGVYEHLEDYYIKYFANEAYRGE